MTVQTTRASGLLLGLSLGYFLVMLDTTIVTVALPSIGGELGGGLSALQWVSNGYTLTFAALLLTAGAWSDAYGARRVFLVGLGTFAVLSGVSALAGSVGVLIALRALLGVSGALLVPTSLALIARAYPAPADRAKAMGVWAALSGTGLVAGPVLGGVLTDAFGWRAIFLVNVPVALASMAITWRAPETPRRAHGVDLVGQVAAVAALGGLTFGLIQSGPLGWGSPQVLVALAVFVVASAIFVLASRMLPPLLFRSSVFSWGLVAGAIANFGLSGVLFVLSLYFQENRHYPPVLAGLAFLPLTIPTAFNPIFTGRLVARVGPRLPALAGFLMMASGTFAQLSSNLVVSLAGLLVLGFGVSFAIPSLVTAVVGAVPAEYAGIGAGTLNSARQTGAVLGVAVLGTLAGPGISAAVVVAASLLICGAAIVGFSPGWRGASA